MSELLCPYCGFKCEIPCTIPCTEENIECPNCRSIFLYIQQSTSHGTVDYRPSHELNDKSRQMSALKSYRVYIPSHGTFREMYLKSEADKVIADLEESHKKEVSQLLILNREQANSANRLRDSMEQVIRHQKYKRCLAMARWCAAECVVNQDTYKRYSTHKSEFRIGHLRKWRKRWLELAEKFKEAK